MASSVTTAQALSLLRAEPELLSAAERFSLDALGYVVFPDLLTPKQLSDLAGRFDELLEIEDGQARELVAEANVLRLANLVDKGRVWDICYTHPKVLSAVSHVIGGEIHLASLNGRSAPPGHGHQNLHCDKRGSLRNLDYRICNSLWMLDDFTAENGATRLVPRSHLEVAHPADRLSDPAAPHPDEILALGRAGTVVVFNGIAWHGGTANRTDRPRRAIHSFWLSRHIPQQTDQARWLSPETLARLSPPQRYLLHV